MPLLEPPAGDLGADPGSFFGRDRSVPGPTSLAVTRREGLGDLHPQRARGVRRELSAERDRPVQLGLARMVAVPEQRHHLFLSNHLAPGKEQLLQAATDPPAGRLAALGVVRR